MSKDLDRLAQAVAADDDTELPPENPGKPRGEAGDGKWWPDLNPTQLDIFNDEHDVVWGIGEKGSGKTLGFLHRVIRHCYENFNALAYIIAPTQSSGYEGAGHDLVNLALPTWKDGNREAPFLYKDGVMIPNPRSGELLDHGIGLEYTQWRLDPVTKDRHLWIQNVYGLWSKVMLKSILFPSQVDARVRGPAPSLVYLEESTVCEGKEYFTFPRAQLGRRRYIKGPQQFLSSCNPGDPDTDWTFELLYKDMKDPNGVPWPRDKHEPGIRRDPLVAVHYVPYSENVHRLGLAYRQNLESTFRSDPILWARMIEGKWLARPSGIALFKHYFSEKKHIAGNAETNRGILPKEGHPIIIGYDLGNVNTGIVFMQCFETEFGPYWIIFDELCYYHEKIPYGRVVRALLEKMAYWNRRMKYKFQFKHISDNSAFNQFVGATGSVHAQEVQNWSAKLIRENKVRFEGLVPIRLIECPKPPGSVEERASIMIDLLRDAQIMVSAACPWTRSMLLHLTQDDKTVLEPKKPQKYLHVFDASTYPVFYRKHVALSGFAETSNKAVTVVA